MICSNCKEEITYLNFDVTGTCSAQIYEKDVKEDKPTDYDIDCLTSNAQFDNFNCPACDETLAFTEEYAIKLLKEAK